MSNPPPSTCDNCKKIVPEVKYSYADNCIYCYNCYEIKKAKISKVLTWKRGVWKPSSNTLKKSLSHAFIRDDVSICGKFDTNSSTWIGVVKSQINPCKQCSQLAKKIIE